MTSSPLAATLQAVDTVVMVQARDRLGTAAAVADVALATVFLLILVMLVVLLLQLRGIHGTVRELSGRLERRLDPVIDRGKEVAANVEFITGALRTDVQRVSDSVKSLSERLQGASDRMEERVEEFNALMEVVQSEAEDIFIGSAATVRGVRAGARALGAGAPEDGAGLDEDDVLLEDEAGLPPRALEPAALETPLAPQAAPGGVQVTGSGSEGRGRRSGGA